MEWMQSTGGPLVVVADEHLAAWRGVRGSSAGDDSPDYSRACAVKDEIGIIRSGQCDVLVLGDEPHRTAWVSRENGGLLVRWVYADSELSVETIVGEIQSEGFEDTGLLFELRGPGRLIDSADPGDALTQGSLAMPLVSGAYRVLTRTVDVGRELRLVVHSLVRR